MKGSDYWARRLRLLIIQGLTYIMNGTLRYVFFLKRNYEYWVLSGQEPMGAIFIYTYSEALHPEHLRNIEKNPRNVVINKGALDLKPFRRLAGSLCPGPSQKRPSCLDAAVVRFRA